MTEKDQYDLVGKICDKMCDHEQLSQRIANLEKEREREHILLKEMQEKLRTELIAKDLTKKIFVLTANKGHIVITATIGTCKGMWISKDFSWGRHGSEHGYGDKA